METEEFIEKGKTIRGFEFLGVAVFRDALKANAKEALVLAEKLGIDIKIVTGDHLEVAKRVALEMGLIKEDEKVFSEQELK